MKRIDVTEALPDPVVRAVSHAIRVTGARIVGLTGPPGAGKSTIARGVVADLAPTTALAISMDDFYLPKAERARQGLRFRGGPGSHDLAAMIDVLERFRHRELPITVPRFDASIDDRTTPTTIHRAPDVLILEGWFLGYPAEGYGAVAALVDALAYIEVPLDLAKQRRFGREADLRRSGGGFEPDEMEAFWDEILAPGIARLVPAARDAADLVVRLDATGGLVGAEASPDLASKL